MACQWTSSRRIRRWASWCSTRPAAPKSCCEARENHRVDEGRSTLHASSETPLDLRFASCQSTRMDEFAAPALIIAMPDLLDPNFHRTVVLLIEKNDQGAFGVVINRVGDSKV